MGSEFSVRIFQLPSLPHPQASRAQPHQAGEAPLTRWEATPLTRLLPAGVVDDAPRVQLNQTPPAEAGPPPPRARMFWKNPAVFFDSPRL